MCQYVICPRPLVIWLNHPSSSGWFCNPAWLYLFQGCAQTLCSGVASSGTTCSAKAAAYSMAKPASLFNFMQIELQ